MIDEKRLQELEQMAERATPRPWHYETYTSNIYGAGNNWMAETGDDEDAAYIVTACNAVPELCAELAQARARIAELEPLAQKCKDYEIFLKRKIE